MNKLKKAKLSPAISQLVHIKSGILGIMFQNDCFSAIRNCKSGVPQGSILGSLLFCLFINELPDSSKEVGCQVFADDAIIYMLTKTPQQKICDGFTASVGQKELEKVNVFKYLGVIVDLN